MKMETLTQVFSCEFCEIFKESFFKVHLLATASVESLLKTSPLCSEEGKNESSDYYIFWKQNIFVAQHIFGFASSVKNSWIVYISNTNALWKTWNKRCN